MSYKHNKYLIFGFCFLLLCVSVHPLFAKTVKKPVRRVVAPSPKITEVKYWTGAESSQIAFYKQGNVDYDVKDLPDKKGFVFYTNNATYNGGDESYSVKDGVIDKIVMNNSGNSCRITVTFMVPTDYQVSRTHVDRNYPVIEITRPKELQHPRPTPEQIAELKKDHKIIMIDPGHGGWHYGAGGNGLMEKNITLQLALKLKDKIDRMPGYIAFLTRDTGFNNGDYYVSLVRRRELAEEYGADLFISLHLNSPGSESRKDVHGTEIYYFAYGDASDAEAQALANLENAADLDPVTTKSSDPVSEILQDERLLALSNQNSLLAGLSLNNILEAEGLTSRGVKHARFAVLKNPIPSILIEMVFVTNPHEARLVSDPSWQVDVTQKLGSAINQYFTMNKGRPMQNGLSSTTPKSLNDILTTPAN